LKREVEMGSEVPEMQEVQIVWEFTVRADRIVEFVSAYGNDGDWVRLFRRAEGFHGAELLCAVDDPCRFLTVDRWENTGRYAQFHEQFGAEYRALDARLVGITLSEKKLGTFTTA
jgi:hypothetical protein